MNRSIRSNHGCLQRPRCTHGALPAVAVIALTSTFPAPVASQSGDTWSGNSLLNPSY